MFTAVAYSGNVIRFRYLPLVFFALCCAKAAEPSPETVAAFDKYVKLTEEGFAKHQGFEDFLWLDHHPQEKSLVWLQQTLVKPLETLDGGKPIEVPGGVIQHWLGATYVEGSNLDVPGLLLNFGGYQDFFPEQIVGTKVLKHEGDNYDFILRLHRKQIRTVVLNVYESAKYTKIDPLRWTIAARSTKVGESEHPRNKKKFDEDRPVEDAAGYLWRMNFYFRVEQADTGVYIELETITLAREPGGKFSPSRYMTGYQNFPHDFTAYLIDVLQVIFPKPQRHR